MLDLNLIRENKEKVEKLLKNKGFSADLSTILTKDLKRRELLQSSELNKSEQNKLTKQVPLLKKEGKSAEHIFAEVKKLSKQYEEQQEQLRVIEKEIKDELSAIPNLPDEDLVAGDKEGNMVVKTHGKIREFGFKIKDHVELAESLGLVDYQRGAKISGRGTWIYTNLGARLEWALINFFVSEHLKSGYEFIMPPHLLNYESGYTAGQFPKFEEDVFWLENMDPKRFMLPTAETALINYHRNEILKEEELPRKYFAYTPCYRQEAGSYRSEERGMIRGYQFNKVEMVQFTTQENSCEAFDELVFKAQDLLEKLDLHFQVSKLAAGDISASMARTYDLEVYLPSLNIYKEVSSVSNARDYQARRGMIRYRCSKTNSTKLCHTLNASGLATSRLFPAILEQNQQEDGSVIIPKVLVPFMGGIEVIKSKNK